MTDSLHYLYRTQVYQEQLHREHVNFLRQGLSSYLTIPHPLNHLQMVALLNCRNEKQIIARLNNKQNKTQLEHLFLIVALQLAGQAYHAELADFKRAFPNYSHSEQIGRYVAYFNKIPPVVAETLNKVKVKYEFEKLLGKANNEGYYAIPEVPVFLVCTKWLELLYSPSHEALPPINNEILLQPVPFPIADPLLMHYNYRIRQDLRENEDYKLVSYQAWQYLQKSFGGMEVRRMTTREKQPIVQVWLVTANVLVVEERCVFHKVELQVSKGDSFNQVIQRIKTILTKYRIVPEKYLSRTFSLYKSKELTEREVVSVLHDDTKPHITHSKFERIAEWNLQVEEAGILTAHDFLILNLSSERGGIFSKLPNLKVMSLREKCLNCGSVQDLTACKCRSVFFCGQKCRQAQKGHQKECNSLQVQARKLNAVIQYYSANKRVFTGMKDLHLSGKVGLENLGNTCYMNSALQCLMRLVDLADFFLQNKHLKDLNVSNVLGSEGHMACAFGEFVKNFYTSGRRKLEPKDILLILQKNPQFRGYNHQDSQEFLNYFLDKLHEDLNRIRVKPYTEDVESQGRPDAQVSRLSWQNYKKRNDSFISDLFAGQYRSQIMCPDCKKLSITFDPFLSVTLQFPRPDKGELLQGYFMTKDGEFDKVKVEVKPNAPTYEFYRKYFYSGVQGANVRDKKLTEFWDPTKSIFMNRRSGLIFFYEKLEGMNIQISVEFLAVGKETAQHLPRITFAKELMNQEDLMKAIYLATKNPFLKVLPKDQTEQSYLALCLEKQPIRIRSIEQNDSTPVFPIIGSRHIRVRVELLPQQLGVAPKMNVTMGTYQGREQGLLRKVKDELTMRELLQCFSEPEQLTEDNTWYCPVCKDHKLADKVMSLYSLPEYLIVHLKRFNHRGNRFVIYGQKVNTAIKLQQFEEINGKKYELLGVVNHFGSLVHGHYTACVKREDWFNYNDSQVGRSSLDGKNAYLLFYKQAK